MARRRRRSRKGLVPVVRRVRGYTRSGYTRKLKNGRVIRVRPHRVHPHERRYYVRMGPPVSLTEARELFERRSKRSRTLDAKSRARVVLEPGTPESGLWRVKPNRYDLEGVDTPTKGERKVELSTKNRQTFERFLADYSSLPKRRKLDFRPASDKQRSYVADLLSRLDAEAERVISDIDAWLEKWGKRPSPQVRRMQERRELIANALEVFRSRREEMLSNLNRAQASLLITNVRKDASDLKNSGAELARRPTMAQAALVRVLAIYEALRRPTD